jgi:tRNA 2-thiouridine synthesizing protein C
MSASRKKIMVLNRKAPHGSIYAYESLEVVLIAAAFNQDVALVFLDDGVYQILKNQNTKGIETKNFTLAYRALEEHDVKTVYVERESLERRGLAASDLLIPATVIGAAELADRIAEQDLVLSS